MNNKDKKVLFFDVDGTLVNSNTMKIEKSTKEILAYLAKRDDIDMYVSTGRTYEGLTEIEEIKPYLTGYNLANGCQIYIGNQEVFTDPIDEKILEKLVKEFEEKKISYVLLESGFVYKHYFNEDLRQVFDNIIKVDYKEVKSFADVKIDKIIEIWVLEIHPIVDELIKEYPTLTFYKWGNYGCDVVKQGASKALGIKRIIDICGYDLKNTFAFGDADNDVPMLKYAATSIAMGQGNDNAKKAATYVTDRIENDGLKKAIEKYVLNIEKKS